MKQTAKSRLPWVALLALVSVLVCARSDFRLRERADLDMHRVLQRLATQPTTYNSQLEWLALYPEIRSAEVIGPTGTLLASYQSSTLGGKGEIQAYTINGSNGVGARLSAARPEPIAIRRDLPLLLLTLFFLALAVPGRPSGAPPSASQDLVLEPSPPSAVNLVLELDSEMRIQAVSQGVERFGYKASQLVGSAMADFVDRFHPCHPESVLGVSQAGGGVLDSMVSSSSVQNAAGAIEKIVVTLAAPASSEASDLRARYGGLERLCQAICDHARDGVIILDSAAKLVYANTSFRDLLGDRGALSESLLSKISPADRLAFTDCLQSAIDGRATSLVEVALEPPASALLEGSFHALRARDQSGGAVLAVGIFRDVSEARRLAEALDLARSRAGHSQKIEALGRMAGGVAHDFNNLLAVMVFNLEAAQAVLPSDCEAGIYLEELRLAAEKASSVTRQLLLYSRKKPALPRLVSAHQAARDALRLTQGLRGQLRIETRLEASRDSVLLDDGQLDQVLLNLVVNAKDASTKGGVIELSTENRTLVQNELPTLPEGEYLILRIVDDGCGIPEEIQSKIFEPYFTTKGVGEGTGLGLSTVLAIVEKSGGQVFLTSRPGRTVFEVWLPVAQAGEPSPEPIVVARPRPAAAAGKTHILLVEDESAIRNLMHRLLEQHGYAVTSAATGSAAAELLRGQQRFDMLVTDLVLPGVSGPDLAKSFHGKSPGHPVLFMSGFPGDTLDETEIGGNTRFLAKPFSPEQLFLLLGQLLGEPA